MRTKQVYIVLMLMLICVSVMCGCGQKKELSFEATYTIDADLEPEMRRMTYTETVEVVNTGSGSTKTLYFHIYGNKFKGLRQVEDGDIVVLSAQDQNGNALQWQREQEGVLYCVELAQKLEPGQSMELTFACEVLIPDLESMYGVSRDGDVQLPMFSLQLAMYDQNGWDTAPLPENGDGRYGAVAEEKVNVPSDEASVYQQLIYDRGAVFLKTLMDAVGKEELLSILSDYCQKYRYGVATTEGFLEILCEETDVDISDIVEEFIK